MSKNRGSIVSAELAELRSQIAPLVLTTREILRPHLALFQAIVNGKDAFLDFRMSRFQIPTLAAAASEIRGKTILIVAPSLLKYTVERRNFDRYNLPHFTLDRRSQLPAVSLDQTLILFCCPGDVPWIDWKQIQNQRRIDSLVVMNAESCSALSDDVDFTSGWIPQLAEVVTAPLVLCTEFITPKVQADLRRLFKKPELELKAVGFSRDMTLITDVKSPVRRSSELLSTIVSKLKPDGLRRIVRLSSPAPLKILPQRTAAMGIPTFVVSYRDNPTDQQAALENFERTEGSVLIAPPEFSLPEFTCNVHEAHYFSFPREVGSLLRMIKNSIGGSVVGTEHYLYPHCYYHCSNFAEFKITLGRIMERVRALPKTGEVHREIRIFPDYLATNRRGEVPEKTASVISRLQALSALGLFEYSGHRVRFVHDSSEIFLRESARFLALLSNRSWKSELKKERIFWKLVLRSKIDIRRGIKRYLEGDQIPNISWKQLSKVISSDNLTGIEMILKQVAEYGPHSMEPLTRKITEEAELEGKNREFLYLGADQLYSFMTVLGMLRTTGVRTKNTSAKMNLTRYGAELLKSMGHAVSVTGYDQLKSVGLAWHGRRYLRKWLSLIMLRSCLQKDGQFLVPHDLLEAEWPIFGRQITLRKLLSDLFKKESKDVDVGDLHELLRRLVPASRQSRAPQPDQVQ